MQRKDIDEETFADLRSMMEHVSVSGGDITLITGRHPLFGALILVSAGGAYAVLGNDVHLIVGRDDTLEQDMLAAA